MHRPHEAVTNHRLHRRIIECGTTGFQLTKNGRENIATNIDPPVREIEEGLKRQWGRKKGKNIRISLILSCYGKLIIKEQKISNT